MKETMTTIFTGKNVTRAISSIGTAAGLFMFVYGLINGMAPHVIIGSGIGFINLRFFGATFN